MKVGIIGCGGIANVHAWVLEQMEDVEIAALCDIDENKAKALKSNLLKGREVDTGRGIQTYSDWHEMLRQDLDVVHICTPHFLHASMAVEALDKGKAVLMEKPCGISMKDFEALKIADEAHPGKLGFCFQNRYNETTKLMDKLICGGRIKETGCDGRIGEVGCCGRIGEVIGARAFVTWRRDENYYLESPWKGKLETEGGGALINQSIHTLDLLLRYLGEPVKVEGCISNHHLPGVIEVEDTVEAWMEFPKGKRACFYASNGYVADAPILLEVQGTRGRICMNGSEVSVWPVRGKVERYMCEQEKGIGKSYWGCGHRACIRDFYWTLSNGGEFQNCLAGVENTFTTMMRIYGRK